MDKSAFIILLVFFHFGCTKKEAYVEYLFSESMGNGKYHHCLFVGGDYNLKDKVFEQAACRHMDTVEFHTPVSSVSFVKSKKGTHRYKKHRSITSVDFDAVGENTLLSIVYNFSEIVYDFSKKNTISSCPPIKYIFYHKTKEKIVREKKYIKYLFNEDIGKYGYRHYLFVGGYYNHKDNFFEQVACEYSDTVSFQKPISEITFLYSDMHTKKKIKAGLKNPVDFFYEIKGNELLSIFYDLTKQDTSFACPPIKQIFYNKTGEMTKR